MMRRRTLLAATPLLMAQAPRPITLVVPFTPGAPPDLVGRVVAEGLQRRLGTPVVAENRSGASGTIGAAVAARAAPDGQTLMVHTTTLAMSATLYRSLPFDPGSAFTPVAVLVETGYALCANSANVADFAALLTAARARPGTVPYASPGVGTPHHLTMELFAREAGLNLTHVPYRGTAGAVTDLLSGQVAAMFMPVGAAVELAKDGRIRILAVASEARLPSLPAVPTVAELGVQGVAMRDWFALFLPARATPEIVARLNTAVNAVLAEPGVAAALEAQGLTVVGGAPERLRDQLALDLPRWAKVVRDANISAD